MRCLICAIGIIVVIACAQAAFLPKLPKLVMKYDDDSEEDGAAELPLFKLPNLFGKPTLKEKLSNKKEALLEKDTLLEKLADKKEDKFEDRLLDFFGDKDKARTVFDKIQGYNFGKSTDESEKVEKDCKCKERSYDNCDDTIRYFS